MNRLTKEEKREIEVKSWNGFVGQSIQKAIDFTEQKLIEKNG